MRGAAAPSCEWWRSCERLACQVSWLASRSCASSHQHPQAQRRRRFEHRPACGPQPADLLARFSRGGGRGVLGTPDAAASPIFSLCTLARLHVFG